MTGKFITIEGIDGAGKTSVADSIEVDALMAQSPTDSWIGKRVREAIKNEAVTDLSTLYFFMADMAYNVDEIIEPALSSGVDVVCDRYFDSTIAYQYSTLSGRVSLPRQFLKDAVTPWYVKPDLTIYLRISVDTALDRIGGESDTDRFERRDVLEEVKTVYDMLSTTEDRYIIVDAERPLEAVVDEVAGIVWQRVER